MAAVEADAAGRTDARGAGGQQAGHESNRRKDTSYQYNVPVQCACCFRER
jgi:hypothetical protein